DDGSKLGDLEGRRIAGGVAARTEDVELRRGLAGTRGEDGVGEGAAGYDDAGGEGNRQALVKEAVSPPRRKADVQRPSKAQVRRESHAPQVRHITYPDRKENNRHDN